jgi:hypothetical protein
MTLNSTRTLALQMAQARLAEAAAKATGETDLVQMRLHLTELFAAGHGLYALNLAAEEETRRERLNV